MIRQRPKFENAEAWLDHYFRAIEANKEPLEPRTRAELEIADLHGLFEKRPYWRPPARELVEHYGLPEWFGRTVDPMDDRQQEQFLQTLVQDEEFRSAVRHFLFRESGE